MLLLLLLLDDDVLELGVCQVALARSATWDISAALTSAATAHEEAICTAEPAPR